MLRQVECIILPTRRCCNFAGGVNERRDRESLLDIDFAALTVRRHTASPAAWEDQVLYFLLVDRFSDGNERGGYRDNNEIPLSGTTPLYMQNNTGRDGIEADGDIMPTSR